MRKPHDALRRVPRSPFVRAVVAVLLVLVGASSVEVVWAQAERGVASSERAAAEGQTGPEEDCPCFCACACEPVHVVVPTLREPDPELAAAAFPPPTHAVTPTDRTADPPFHPPRRLA